MWDLYRGPLLASLFMGISSSLVGVLLFIRRRSLLGEALSHATYPGVALAVLLLSSPWVPLGALATALIGFLVIERLGEGEDATLCFVLATFFGVGLTLGSLAQFRAPAAYRQIEMYLYGQAATMGDRQMTLYLLFTLVAALSIFLLYKEIQAISFDPRFSRLAGLPKRLVNGVCFALILVAIIGGIRAVGVVLMSAMLIAPPAAARQWTHNLPTLFFISALVGGCSGVVGCLLSIWTRVPTGAAIVLVASLICIISLLFGPERGLLFRAVRMAQFRMGCAQENALKLLWKRGPQPLSKWMGGVLRRQGWVRREGALYRLTTDGERRASRIVRLHRLWEVYLVDYLGVGAARVHKSAEEMEHIITPEIEQELTGWLGDPEVDPHAQPIPRGRW